MTINRLTAAIAALALFAAGAAATYVWLPRAAAPPASRGAASHPATNAEPTSESVIRIPADLMSRAGIRAEPASTASVPGEIRVPASVQPNAYRQVSVTPLVGGRVTRMFVELGQSIRRGAPVAEIYSPAIAELRAQYFNARADTDAGEARLRRTERLAALGSASQQDLEQVRAEHVRHETQVREAAARLKLLGIDAARLDDAHADAPSTVIVSAPQDGVVTERPVTAGATVDASTSLAIIADLSQVWVMADVYERDLARVAVGAPVSATSAAYPGVEWRGRVTYIAPAVRPETRTAQVRIEIANTDGRLKFGMFVDAAIGGIATPGLTIPASAVQTMGEQSIVFVPVAAGVFRPRRVKLGPPSGDRVAVLDGLAPGESVVTAGSFAVRAEAERQGVRLQASQAADVAITASGFEPASLHLQPGVPARVTFTRKTDQTCATDVAIPAYGIKRPLPLNQPVTVEFVPAAGDAAFQCGMGMLTGTLVVR